MPDKPEKRPRKDPGRGKDAKPPRLKKWMGGQSDPEETDAEETEEWDYDADLPESVMPDLHPASAVTVGSSPPTEAELARAAAAEAAVKKENEEANQIEFTDIASRAIADLEEAAEAERRTDAAKEQARKLKESIEEDRELLESIQAERRAAVAEEAAKVKRILDDQRDLLDSIEAPKRAAAEAKAERTRKNDEEKKKRFDSALERLVGGVGLFLLLGAIGFGCKQVIGDDNDTASNEPTTEESADDPLVAIGQEDDVTPETPSEPVEPETPVDPKEPPPLPPGSGTTEIAASVNSACGGMYDVFLRVMAFNNYQVTADQLSTKGGNPFQSAAGWSNSRIAMATMTEQNFYEVWFFVWNLGDLLAIYNVYGTAAEFTPPESADDLATYESVDSAAALASAVGASEDSCASEVQLNEVANTPFPTASS